VSKPAVATPAVWIQLDDFASYGMVMPAVTVNTDGTVSFSIRGDRVAQDCIFAIHFNYFA
jgi:hypothetical protein